MKPQNILLIVTTVVASFFIAVGAKADTVKARCDVYLQGEDRASSSGPCTFSQRQGFVGIQLQNGKRYDLSPVGDRPGNYLDQNGKAAYRQAGLGDRGQIYRLATESIYVYWDATSNDKDSNSSGSGKSRISTLRSDSPNGRISVRSQPTISSSSPHYGVAGDKVEVIRCVQDRDTADSDLNWCNIRFVESGATGWVRSDFLIFADDGK